MRRMKKTIEEEKPKITQANCTTELNTGIYVDAMNIMNIICLYVYMDGIYRYTCTMYMHMYIQTLLPANMNSGSSWPGYAV